MLDKETVKKIREFFKDKPVLRAYVFGSFARGEGHAESDIDLLVDLDYSRPIGLFFVRMQLDLEELLGRKVDLISNKGLSKYVCPYVDRDKQLVYEKQDRGHGEIAAHA
jgi:predicted nucleotidyltransferase